MMIYYQANKTINAKKQTGEEVTIRKGEKLGLRILTDNYVNLIRLCAEEVTLSMEIFSKNFSILGVLRSVA